jgi:hypothetical protein
LKESDPMFAKVHAAISLKINSQDGAE